MGQNKNKHTMKIIMATILVIPMLAYVVSNTVFGQDAIIVTDPIYQPDSSFNDPTTTTTHILKEPIVEDESESQASADGDTTDPIINVTNVQSPAPGINTTLKIEPGSPSDTVDLTVTTDQGTDTVELFVDDSNEDEDTYLGSGEKKESTSEQNKEEWELRIEKEKRLPDGEHDVYAKIREGEREYESERIRLKIERQHEEQRARLKEDFGELNPDLDFDEDGLSNSDEKRLGTNPYLADTDNDGYIDGDEVRNGFNPLIAAAGDKSDRVIFETPKESGVVHNSYEVKNVELKKFENGDKVAFSGKALPNTFVRVYIYSDKPIIITVRTDSNGDWSYELDKELENGDHEVYVAVTDNTGKITSKSNPLAFVKTAEAISATPTASAAAVESPVKELGPNNIFYAIIIIILVFAISLVLIKTLMAHKQQ